MNNKLIEYSIIIPVYNSEKHIERCLKSFCNQTIAKTKYELIIIDDGSFDDSHNIISKFPFEDIKYTFKRIENRGVGFARNLGISLAKGRYLIFVDSDDEVSENYLEVFSSSSGLVIQGFTKIDRNGEVLYNRSFDESVQFILKNGNVRNEWFENLLMHGFPVCKKFDSTIIRQNNIKFPIDINLHEDHVFWFKYLMYVSEVSFVDNIGYIYHNANEDSLTKKRHSFIRLKKSSDLMFSTFNTLLDVLDFCPKEIRRSVLTFTISPIFHGLYQIFVSEGFFSLYRRLDQNVVTDKCKCYYPKSLKGVCFKYFVCMLTIIKMKCYQIVKKY